MHIFSQKEYLWSVKIVKIFDKYFVQYTEPKFQLFPIVISLGGYQKKFKRDLSIFGKSAS